MMRVLFISGLGTNDAFSTIFPDAWSQMEVKVLGPARIHEGLNIDKKIKYKCIYIQMELLK